MLKLPTGLRDRIRIPAGPKRSFRVGPDKRHVQKRHLRLVVPIACMDGIFASEDRCTHDPRLEYANVHVLLFRVNHRTEDMKHGRPCKDPCYPYPEEGVIRAVASMVAHVRRSHPRIRRLDRVIRDYCSMMYGRKNPYVVEWYLFERLFGLVEVHRRAGRPITREDLERAAEGAVEGIVERLFQMAHTGEEVKRESRPNVRRVRAKFLERKGLCFLTLGRARNGDTTILCLQSAGLYRRRMDRRFVKKKEPYRNDRSFKRR